MGLRAVTAAGAVVGSLSLSACSAAAAGPPATTPDDAVVLSENQPADIDGGRAVATGVDGDSATVRIADGTSPFEPHDVEEGTTVVIGAESYRVEAIWSEGDSGEPGGQGGRVMLVPTP
ncbi:hypothetical protein GCM10022199_21780 [Marihabitans asiaticum]